MTLESLLEGLDHQLPGTSSASRDCRTLKTINDHPGPCHESPFVIARIWHVNGGKIGGIFRFFQAETTVLEPSQNVFWLAGELVIRTPGQRCYVLESLSADRPLRFALRIDVSRDVRPLQREVCGLVVVQGEATHRTAQG